MYKIKVFTANYPSELDRDINYFLDSLDSDYQYLDLKLSSAGTQSSFKHTAILIMNYIPKRRIIFEKLRI